MASKTSVRAVEKGVVTDIGEEFGAKLVRVAQTDGHWQEYTLDDVAVARGDLVEKNAKLGAVKLSRVRSL